MSKFWKTVSEIFAAKANDVVEAIQDPVAATHQTIRELTEKHEAAVKSELTLKTLVVSNRLAAEKKQEEAKGYTDQANQLLDQVEKKLMEETEANTLAGEALALATKTQVEADHLKSTADTSQKELDEVNKQVVKLAEFIKENEDHLVTLTAQNEAATTTLAVNKELADVNGLNNTTQHFKDMQAKVDKTHAEAIAYLEIQDASKTTADKIADALKKVAEPNPTDLLAELKAKRAQTATPAAAVTTDAK